MNELSPEAQALSPETEEYVKKAFDDLSRRSGYAAAKLQPSPRPRRPLLPALAFVAATAVAGVTAWQLAPSSDTGIDTTSSATTTEGTASNGDGTASDGGSIASRSGDELEASDAVGPVDTGDSDSDELATEGRLRVATEAVRADANDPFLNVRSDAGSSADLVAKLPPTYRGLRATGEQEVTADGATWIEVEMLHPVAYSGSVSFDANPVGWLNAGLTEPLVDGIGVGLDEVPGCTAPASSPSSGSQLAGSGYVFGLESARLADDCVRVVLTIGEGQAAYAWDSVTAGTAPAASLPAIQIMSSGGLGVVVDLGSVTSAWPQATETGGGVYVVRAADGNLDLVSPLPVRSATVTALPEIGVVVIDLAVAGSAPLADDGIVLTEEPRASAGSVTVLGLARPFEALLGISIEDASGQSVEATYSGSTFLGTMTTDTYAVGTTDWTTAWGSFAVEAKGLDPGDYVMLLDEEGGQDDPDPVRVPFSIAEAADAAPLVPSDDEQKTASAFVRFAQGGSTDGVPFADEVILALGPEQHKTLTASNLADRDAWVVDVDGFAEFAGPFDLLAPPSDGRIRVSRGEINHCAGPPRDWPSDWDRLTQVNIEPIGIDSCIPWYGLSLFLNPAGEIEVVVLDLFGP